MEYWCLKIPYSRHAQGTRTRIPFRSYRLGGIGEVIVIGAAAGLGVLALAAVATASAPVAAGAAAVIVVSSVIIGNTSDNKEA